MENNSPGRLTRLMEIAENFISRYPGKITDGMQFFNGRGLRKYHFPPFTSGIPVLVDLHEGAIDLTSIQSILRFCYPDDMELYLQATKDNESNSWYTTTLAELPSSPLQIEAIVIPRDPASGSLEEFMGVIAHLRAPDGCPWDKKQTHASLRPYLLEETYEALEALDHEDMAGLKEELGDLLLQIALHAVIATENQSFNIGNVISSITRKIITRHPHVFGDVVVKDDRDVTTNWEKIKGLERMENGGENGDGLLDGIPSILPALSQAQSIQDRAARVGFDWPEIKPVLEKVLEELEEVKTAVSEAERAKELGDLLFAVVNLVRWHKVDAESALRETNNKFRKRFAYIEEQARLSGRELPKMSLEEMDELWEAAKSFDEG